MGSAKSLSTSGPANFSTLLIAVRVACGVGLVAVLVLPWTSAGGGSTMTGTELAGALLAHGWEAAGLGIYAMAALGSVLILTAALEGIWLCRLRRVAGASCVLAVVTLTIAGPLPSGCLGPSALLAIVAGGVALAESFVPQRRTL